MAGLSLKFLSGLILLEVVLGASLDEIHHHMTPEEREQVFQTAGTYVPPYKVVQIHSSKVKRGVNAGYVLEMKIHGKPVKSWLTPVDGTLINENTPVYGYSRIRGLSLYPYALKKVFSSVYENKPLGMTISIEEGSRGKRSITGIIGSHNLYVKPIPERAMNELSKKLEQPIGDEFESDHEDKTYHIVYEMPLAHDNSTIMSPLTQFVSREKRSEDYNIIVYPEILVIVDWSLVLKLGVAPNSYFIDLSKILIYLTCFWNGVDLKYRDLEHPKYRLNIAGIVLATEYSDLPYILKVSFNDIDVRATLEGSGTWLFNQHEIINRTSYDAAITMTATNLQFKSETGSSIILGRAHVSAACLFDPKSGKMLNIGIVHDAGGFDGIHTAAHELGHLLGAQHDGTDHEACPYNDGFIMTTSAVINSNKTHGWSHCSKIDFRKFLKTDPKCLLNKPANAHFPRLLPGQIMDANGQCEMIEKTKAFVIDPSICTDLQCYSYGKPDHYAHMGVPAADGTHCDTDRICLHGKCMKKDLIE